MDAKVGDESGLADAAFAAGNGDDAGVLYLSVVADAGECAEVGSLVQT